MDQTKAGVFGESPAELRAPRISAPSDNKDISNNYCMGILYLSKLG